MDNHYPVDGLMYHTDNHHPPANLLSVSWQSPPNSSSSNSSAPSVHSMYRTPDVSPERAEFTRGEYEAPTAPPIFPRSMHDFTQNQLSPSGPAEQQQMFGSPQIESSVGPTRITRRRARADAARQVEEVGDASARAPDVSLVQERLHRLSDTFCPILAGIPIKLFCRCLRRHDHNRWFTVPSL